MENEKKETPSTTAHVPAALVPDGLNYERVYDKRVKNAGFIMEEALHLIHFSMEQFARELLPFFSSLIAQQSFLTKQAVPRG